MQFSTLLITAISALTAIAAPTSAIEERGCKIAYPVNSGYYWVSRYYNPEYEYNQPVVFNLPADAVGACDLKVQFPNPYPPSLWGNTQVEFKYLTGTGTTYTFKPGPLDDTAGSFGCSETMEFLMTISKEQGTPGYVGFPQNNEMGLYMVYGC